MQTFSFFLFPSDNDIPIQNNKRIVIFETVGLEIRDFSKKKNFQKF